MNYYIVTAKCGHLGKRRFLPVSFPVKADSGKDAASIAKSLPRVKKGRKDAIISVEKVCFPAYRIQQFANRCDPYLNVFSRQEQKRIMDLIESRIENEDDVPSPAGTKRKSVKYKLLKESIRRADMDRQIKQYS